MTNKEWMSSLTAEQFYDEMMWLVRDFGFRFTNSRLGIIDWLDQPHKTEQVVFKHLSKSEEEEVEGNE